MDGAQGHWMLHTAFRFAKQLSSDVQWLYFIEILIWIPRAIKHLISELTLKAKRSFLACGLSVLKLPVMVMKSLAETGPSSWEAKLCCHIPGFLIFQAQQFD